MTEEQQKKFLRHLQEERDFINEFLVTTDYKTELQGYYGKLDQLNHTISDFVLFCKECKEENDRNLNKSIDFTKNQNLISNKDTNKDKKNIKRRCSF